MDYDQAAAERLEAVYLTADVKAQREHTLSLLRLNSGEAVLDIGSGPGFLCDQMGELVGSRGKVHGIDISPVMISRSIERNDKPWISFAEGDAANFDEADASYDVVVSTQVAEYVPDVAAFCGESFRVLKPGGRGVIMATDWDAVAWHSEDRERMKDVMAAFAPHCVDGVLPRTLAPRLRASGFVVKRVSSFPILNLDWSSDNYSCLTIPFIVAYIKTQGSLDDELLDEWAAEQRQLASRGEYYFLSSRIYFEVSKPSLD